MYAPIFSFDNSFNGDMKPSKEELAKHTDIREAARHFQVSERTIRRWLKHYDMYHPKQTYQSKLDIAKAREIRRKYSDGIKMKVLAEEYQVSIVTISKVVNGFVHKEPVKETADISVIYNC